MKILSDTEMQAYCEAQGKLPSVEHGSGGWCYPVGLCAKCNEPIAYHLTNGGKLKSARTLRLEHVFSGNIICEDDATNAILKTLPADQKFEFFSARRDRKVLTDAGYSGEALEKQMAKVGHKT